MPLVPGFPCPPSRAQVEAPQPSAVGGLAAAQAGGAGPSMRLSGNGKPLMVGSGSGGGAGKALLSREEMIEKGKDGASAASAGGSDSGDEGCAYDEVVVPKPIFIISDCTGGMAGSCCCGGGGRGGKVEVRGRTPPKPCTPRNRRCRRHLVGSGDGT
jgi:hypothetical protein